MNIRNKITIGLVGLTLQLFPFCNYNPSFSKFPITDSISLSSNSNNNPNLSKNNEIFESEKEKKKEPCATEIILSMREPELVEGFEKNLEELFLDYLKKTGMSRSKVQKTIVIDKSIRELAIYVSPRGIDSILEPYGILLKTYQNIALGRRAIGDKVREGDRRTPEGEFYVARKVPNSKYHKALLISYPNKEDAKRGLKEGLINKIEYDKIVNSINRCQTPPQNTKLGSYLEIHGHGKGTDWTWGCVGLDNWEMDELYNFSSTGCRKYNNVRLPKTKIIIKP